MNVLMVRSKVKPESVPEVEAAIEKVFAAIEQARPAGVRYASSRLGDGVTFVALLELADGPPAAEQMTVVGPYRLS